MVGLSRGSLSKPVDLWVLVALGCNNTTCVGLRVCRDPVMVSVKLGVWRCGGASAPSTHVDGGGRSLSVFNAAGCPSTCSCGSFQLPLLGSCALCHGVVLWRELC